MQEYQTREIAFTEILEINDWRIKVYTISKNGDFDHPIFYENAKSELPKWLKMDNSFNVNNDKLGFLILHSATEGIFSLINWWVGKNMLNTHVFITDPNEPTDFSKISGDGQGPCIWELEVMHHEASSWRDNVLKQGSKPDYQAYLRDVYNGRL